MKNAVKKSGKVPARETLTEAYESVPFATNLRNQRSWLKRPQRFSMRRNRGRSGGLGS